MKKLTDRRQVHYLQPVIVRVHNISLIRSVVTNLVLRHLQLIWQLLIPTDIHYKKFYTVMLTNFLNTPLTFKSHLVNHYRITNDIKDLNEN